MTPFRTLFLSLDLEMFQHKAAHGCYPEWQLHVAARDKCLNLYLKGFISQKSYTLCVLIRLTFPVNALGKKNSSTTGSADAVFSQWSSWKTIQRWFSHFALTKFITSCVPRRFPTYQHAQFYLIWANRVNPHNLNLRGGSLVCCRTSQCNPVKCYVSVSVYLNFFFVKSENDNFSEPKVTSSNVFFCLTNTLKPKDIPITIT